MFKQFFENKKAVFFDLDGTIVDSNAMWEQAMVNVLKLSENDWVDFSELPAGMYLEEKWDYIVSMLNLDVKNSIKELVELTNREYFNLAAKAGIKVKDGFWSFHYEIKQNLKLKTALISNADKAIVTEVLRIIGMENLFDFIIGGDEVKKHKPAPDVYIAGLKNLNLKPQEVLVFEDSLPGVESARNAGLDVIVIWDGKHYKEEYKGPILTFAPDFSQFVGALDKTRSEYLKGVYFMRTDIKPEEAPLINQKQ
ncbi:HAD family phosphatase [Patescibacteria group bacterium]|nr:HAD family phosphatase [Patescibacteria group bacterium]